MATTNSALLSEALARMPLVAILRGVRPDEALSIAEACIDAGFAIVEVPLNSPDPFESIARIAAVLDGRAIIGAGTVLGVPQVEGLARAGGRVVISPNANLSVIRRARELGLASLPGVATPTEAFAALDAGADALKLFPAEMIQPVVVKAIRAVLPANVALLPVGGISPETMGPYRRAGASGFGIGSALFKPGMTAEAVHREALRFVAAWEAC
jgi:2-dehydro-3-deoxyphosphogalactonate aldolase